MQSENAPAESDLRLQGLTVASPRPRRSPACEHEQQGLKQTRSVSVRIFTLHLFVVSGAGPF